MKDFGQRLTEQRKQLNMHRAAFAGLLGISEQTQANYENGTAWPDQDYLLSAAHRGVDVGYVITGTESVSKASLQNELKLLSDCWEGIAQVLHEGKKELPADKMRLAAESLHQAIKGGEVFETQLDVFLEEITEMWNDPK